MSTTTSLSPIAVDAMGSDKGPQEILEGVALALAQCTSQHPVILVGDESILRPIMASKGLDKDPRVSVVHASEVIGMHEKPIQSLKSKKDASMVRALELVKDGHAKAVLSCGNTGSLMAGGTLKLRLIEGLERPALATVIPTRGSRFILLDAGANPDSEAKHLVHNAILGSHYARAVLHKPNPKVALLTIGTEEGKGSLLVNEAHTLLKQINGLINYVGPIEGFNVFEGAADVVVCDGFVGNIVLKSCESLFLTLKEFVKDEILKCNIRKLGAWLCRGAFRTIKDELSPERYGGAPLLGVRGTVLKAHGSSNRYAIMHSIRIAREILQYDLNEHIHETVCAANQVLNQSSTQDPKL